MSVLDNFLKDKREKLSKLRKERRKLKKDSDYSNKLNDLDKSIEDLNSYIRRFMKSKMEPAVVGDIVINNKIYDQFLKKLKGLHYEITVTNDRLIIEYGKKPGIWTGKLELFDLSHHFEGYGKVTKEVTLDGQA